MPLSTASCANAMDGNTRMMPTTNHRLTTAETMVTSQVRLCARLRLVVASQAETNVGPTASQRDNDAADDKERSPDAPIRFLRSVVATKSRNHETTKRKSGPFRVLCFRGSWPKVADVAYFHADRIGLPTRNAGFAPGRRRYLCTPPVSTSAA